jgi:hypothetical protein
VNEAAAEAVEELGASAEKAIMFFNASEFPEIKKG